MSFFTRICSCSERLVIMPLAASTHWPAMMMFTSWTIAQRLALPEMADVTHPPPLADCALAGNGVLVSNWRAVMSTALGSVTSSHAASFHAAAQLGAVALT